MTDQPGHFLGCRCVYLHRDDRVEIAADYGKRPLPSADGVAVPRRPVPGVTFADIMRVEFWPRPFRRDRRAP